MGLRCYTDIKGWVLALKVPAFLRNSLSLIRNWTKRFNYRNFQGNIQIYNFYTRISVFFTFTCFTVQLNTVTSLHVVIFLSNNYSTLNVTEIRLNHGKFYTYQLEKDTDFLPVKFSSAPFTPSDSRWNYKYQYRFGMESGKRFGP